VSRPPHFGDLVGNDLSPAERERLGASTCSSRPALARAPGARRGAATSGRLELALPLRTGLLLAAALVIATLRSVASSAHAASSPPSRRAVKTGCSASRPTSSPSSASGTVTRATTGHGGDRQRPRPSVGGDYYTLMTRKGPAGRDLRNLQRRRESRPCVASRTTSTASTRLVLAGTAAPNAKQASPSPELTEASTRERCGRSRRTPRA
jgi:hypothetical protein